MSEDARWLETEKDQQAEDTADAGEEPLLADAKLLEMN